MPATPFRLNRLFDAGSGRALDVAVDHGFFGEEAFLTGIEDMRSVIATLVEAGPDAIQLTPGQAPLLQSIPGKAKPASAGWTALHALWRYARPAAPARTPDPVPARLDRAQLDVGQRVEPGVVAVDGEDGEGPRRRVRNGIGVVAGRVHRVDPRARSVATPVGGTRPRPRFWATIA